MDQGGAWRSKRLFASWLLYLFDVALRLRHRRLVNRIYAAGMPKPALAAPALFSEKVHWRKIFDDDPRFAVLLDKLKAKDMVRSMVPWLESPEVVWQGDDPAKIPFDRLTIPYIVKCNHGCKMNAAVPDPAKADRGAIVARMRKHLATTYGASKLERAYAHIQPRVFVEALIGRERGYVPVDYKFSTIGGRVAYVVVTADRASSRRVGFYDRDWRRIALGQTGIASTFELDPPVSFARMIEAAEALGADFDMLRVDMYEDDGEPVFGEFTVYPRSGLLRFDPPEFDRALGDRWNLAASAYLSRPPGVFARIYRALLAAAGHIPA